MTEVITTPTRCKPQVRTVRRVDPTPKYPACPEEYHASCKRECDLLTRTTATLMTKRKDRTRPAPGRNAKRIQYALLCPRVLDFPTYKSGVYKHTTGSFSRSRCVDTSVPIPTAVIGSSISAESKEVIASSKIARGDTQCGIEGDVLN